MIPEHWEVKPLQTLANIERGKFTARPRNDPKYYGGEIPFIQTGDVTNSSCWITTYSQTLNSEGLKVSKLFPQGTLFFTIAANIGDVAITRFATACPDSLVSITPARGIDKQWLAYELAKRKPLFENLASHNAQLNINLEKLRPYLLPVPTLAEQAAIAEALSDADALIESLEQLLTKKRQIKKGAMQELLTGKKRLPGFSGEWEVKRLGEVLKFQVGFPFSSVHFNEADQGVRLVKNRDLKNDDQVIYYSGGFAQEFLVRDGDVLIGMDGDFLPCMWAKGSALLNQRVGRIVAHTSLDLAFAFYYLLAPLKEIESTTSGTTVKHLSHGDIEGIEKPLPTLPEQTAIATILSDMDTEITALEAKRSKAHQIKQGMMQELLTGRIRLL